MGLILRLGKSNTALSLSSLRRPETEQTLDNENSPCCNGSFELQNFEPFSSQIKCWLSVRAGINKMLVRIANREDSDQTASSEAV